MNFVTGDVVSSGISTKTPSGFLREVISVSTDKKTFYTSQATLEQAVKDGTLNYSGSLTPPLTSPGIMIDGVRILPKTSTFNFNINLNNVILYDRDGDKNTEDDQLIANGNISFNTDVVFNIKINNHGLEELIFKNSTDISSDITVGANTFGIAQTHQIKIAEYDFQPFVVGYLPIPPIPILLPVIAVPKLGVYIGIDPTNVNPLSVRVKQNADLNVALTYKGLWNFTSNFSNNFEFSNPVINDDLELKVFAGPNLEFSLYDIGGPFGSLNGRLRLKHQNSAWELYGGFGASLGVKMDVLKKNYSIQFKEIINYEKLLVKGETPVVSEKILFTSNRSGDTEIYSMNPDGSNQVNLTNNVSHEYESSWSPDKNQFVFVSERDGNPEVYTMKLDGTTIKRLTNNSATERFPDWSPDGKEIVFYSQRNANQEIFLMNSDGSNQRKIDISFGIHINPRWAPDANKIAFSSTLAAEGSYDIHTINKNGTGLQRLTKNSAAEIEPDWSPDGKKIAFSTNRDGNYEIYVMDADGSNQTNVSNSPSTYESSPSWSPDGKKIVCVSGTGTSSEIWTMNADGSNKKRITNNSYNDGSPRWSPK